MKYFLILIRTIIWGCIWAFIGSVVLIFISDYVGIPLKKSQISTALISFWGIFMGLSVGTSILLFEKYNGHIFSRLLTTCFALILGGFLGSLLGGISSGAYLGGFFIGGIYSSCITFFLRFPSIKSHYWMVRLSGIFGGCLAGGFAGLLWGILGRGAFAEGYILLVVVLFMLVGIFVATGISLGLYFPKGYAGVGLKIFTTIFFLLSIVYLGIQNTDFHLFETPMSASSIEMSDKPFETKASFKRNDLISLLQDKKNKNIIDYVTLFEFTHDFNYARIVKDLLQEEIKNKKFTDPAHSIKSVQFDAAIRAYAYEKIENVEMLFTVSEKKAVVSWFKDIIERIFSVEWVDYLYAIAFSRPPIGPYENQEIGVGALSIISAVIADEYPDVATRCRRFIKEHAVCWGENFRNTDDSVNYQTWWIYSSYLVAKYGGQISWLKHVNAFNSFEWLLAQWPPNGMKLGYNDINPINITDTMALGASLFKDGRYKWLALRTLADSFMHGDAWTSPLNLGLSMWDDDLQPVKPRIGSVYLQGPGGLPHNPGPDMPDKIVFRDGWNDDSFYALLNLRYSGWHKYKATNCFASVVYGKPFVVEDHIFKKHLWLPAGRAYYRDKKIDRVRLNGMQFGLEGYGLLVHDLLGIGSGWAQNPPRYAEVKFFEDRKDIAFSKSVLSSWNDWKSERIALLLKGKMFIVFDAARRDLAGSIAVTWHFKGERVPVGNHLRLYQHPYAMDVFFPYLDKKIEEILEKSDEDDPPNDDIHAPDFNLNMVAQNRKEAGFVSVFVPFKGASYSVDALEVMDSGGGGISARSDAMGVCISESGSGKEHTIFGVSFKKGTYLYRDINTDAGIFYLTHEKNKISLYCYGASFLSIELNKKPESIYIAGKKIEYGKSLIYSDEKLLFNNLELYKQNDIDIDL